MSAGVFEIEFYELDTGNGGGVASIRVQPETVAATINGAANAGASGPATIPLFAKAAKGVREYGIGARSVTLRFTGAPPTGYSGDDVRIPVLLESTYASWALNETGSYLGAAVQVVGRSPERIR